MTYSVIFAYLGLTAVVTLWLMWAGRYEVAIGVLAGVVGLAGSITGFWFGSRRPSQSPEGDGFVWRRLQRGVVNLTDARRYQIVEVFDADAVWYPPGDEQPD